MSGDSGQPQLSVVIPILNEEAILWHNAEALAALFDGEIGCGRWKFVLVDNGSTDSTPRIIERICARWPPSQRLFEARHNYGRAMRVGLMAVDTAWVITVDVEQWDTQFLKWAWRNRERYDLIIGSKRADPSINHQTSYRYFLSWGLNALIQLFFGYVGADTHGPKLLRHETMQPIIAHCRMSWGQFDSEFVIRALRAGLWIVEVPVIYVEQRPSQKLMFEKIARNVWEFNRLRRMLRNTRQNGFVRLHRFSRVDVLEQNEIADRDRLALLGR
jgi:glycosyltransferase involved in cell wall biosynthesis